jgi:hypothetical protein
MVDEFKRREPTYPSKVYDKHDILEYFQICDWLGYFERHRGFDDEVSKEFS